MIPVYEWQPSTQGLFVKLLHIHSVFNFKEFDAVGDGGDGSYPVMSYK